MHKMPDKSATAKSRPADLKRLGRYRIVRPLSKGGMALVYEARRESLGGVSLRVAIKLILPEHAESGTFQELFINEARLGAAMQHQNLVQIQDFARDGDHYYLVMEYVTGLTLRHIISLCRRSKVRIPPVVIAEIGRQACEGLAYAHQAADASGEPLNLIHRDIKPSNIILSSEGVVKILDFGISKGRLVQEAQGAVRGTWGYMAPEQAHGQELTGSADLFGLGTVLYELASQQPLMPKKKPPQLKQLLQDDHAARMAATLGAEYTPLVPLLVRVLQRDPQARYASAQAFGRALSDLLPDPMITRTELKRFISLMHERERAPAPGHPPKTPPPQGPVSPSATPHHQKVAHSRLSTVVSRLIWWVPVGVFVVVGGGAGLWLAGGSAGWSSAVPQSPATILVDRSRPTEEPPGPAGKGAPGEAKRELLQLRPPPINSIPAHGSAGGGPPGTRDQASPEAPVVVVVDRSPKVEEVPQAVVTPVAPEDAFLTLSAVPAGLPFEIWIDGVYVASGALVRHKLPAGLHTITLTAKDGRTQTVDMTLRPNTELRRSWDFEGGHWRK